MSLTNILVVVDLDNIEPKPNKENPGTAINPIQISNPSDCVFLFDDQSEDKYSGPGKSDLITSVDPGDLLVWSLMKKEQTKDELFFVKIDSPPTKLDGDSIATFNWAANDENKPAPLPVVYYKGKKCVAAISDKLPASTQYAYKITFKLIKENDPTRYYYILDPFVETRDDPKP